MSEELSKKREKLLEIGTVEIAVCVAVLIVTWLLGGTWWLQSFDLKELTEGHHQEWSLRLNLTQHGKTHPVRTL